MKITSLSAYHYASGGLGAISEFKKFFCVSGVNSVAAKSDATEANSNQLFKYEQQKKCLKFFTIFRCMAKQNKDGCLIWQPFKPNNKSCLKELYGSLKEDYFFSLLCNGG